jgi:hypothetical protein
MMSAISLRSAVGWSLIAALAVGSAGALALAQDDEQSEGRVVQIGRADDGESQPDLPPPDEGQNAAQPGAADKRQALPKHWIGLRGMVIDADHPLRAHLDLPQGQGLLIVDVVPDSPAAKAGLKRHEILLRANDAELREMTDLVSIVRTAGDKHQQITLEILRHGERETVYVTPEERPADAAVTPERLGDGNWGGFQFPEGFPNELLGELERQGAPLGFRGLGPGVIVGRGRGIVNVPDGVSISIEKQNDQPARITVKRGDQTWEVVGDDAESLEQLPDDVRPFVEQMLNGRAPLGMDFQIPNLEGLGRPGLGDERLQQRLDEMERRMEELLRRFDSKQPRAADTDEADEVK